MTGKIPSSFMLILTEATFGSGGYLGYRTLYVNLPWSHWEIFIFFVSFSGVAGTSIGVRIVAGHLHLNIYNMEIVFGDWLVKIKFCFSNALRIFAGNQII